jgi:lipoprotein NlpI
LANDGDLNALGKLDVNFHLGLMYFMEENFEKANEMFDICTDLSPAFALGHMHKGVSLYRLGKVLEALSCVETAQQLKPDSPEINNILGELYRESESWQKAVDQFGLALKHDPAYPDAFVNQVLLDPSNLQGDPNVLVGKLRAAIKMDDQCQMAYIHLASFYLRMGNMSEVCILQGLLGFK